MADLSDRCQPANCLVCRVEAEETFAGFCDTDFVGQRYGGSPPIKAFAKVLFLLPWHRYCWEMTKSSFWKGVRMR
jgi:hypothetical protein